MSLFKEPYATELPVGIFRQDKELTKNVIIILYVLCIYVWGIFLASRKVVVPFMTMPKSLTSGDITINIQENHE